MTRNHGVYRYGLRGNVRRYKELLRDMSTWGGLTWEEALAALKRWRKS